MSDMYDYIITKPPLDEDTLAHYGIKGMKWHVRKAINRVRHTLNKRKLNAKRLAEDIADGKKKAVSFGPNQGVWGGNRTVGYNRSQNKYRTSNNNGNNTLTFIRGKASDLDKALQDEMVRKKKATRNTKTSSGKGKVITKESTSISMDERQRNKYKKRK